MRFCCAVTVMVASPTKKVTKARRIGPPANVIVDQVERSRIRAMRRATPIAAGLLAACLSAVAAAQTAVPVTAVDGIFSKWTSATPGCAVGVAVGGTPVLVKAYGMADLEHGIANTPETIFESGSVAK